MKKLLLFCVVISLFSCKKDNEGFINECLIEKTITVNKINGGSILQVTYLRIDWKTTDLP